MENKFDTNEIEESLRICEELLQNNPDFNRRAPRPAEALELAKNVSSGKPAQSKPEVFAKPAPAAAPAAEPVAKPVVKPEPEAQPATPAKPVVSETPKSASEPKPKTRQKPAPAATATPAPVSKSKAAEPDDKETKNKPNIKKNLIALGICVVIAVVIALIIIGKAWLRVLPFDNFGKLE